MKINVDEVLTNLKGDETLEQPTFKDGKKVGVENVTVGKVVIDTMLGMTETDKNLKGEIKLKRFKLAEKVSFGGEVDFSVDELKMIKDRVVEMSPVLIVGKMNKIIEGSNGE